MPKVKVFNLYSKGESSFTFCFWVTLRWPQDLYYQLMNRENWERIFSPKFTSTFSVSGPESRSEPQLWPMPQHQQHWILIHCTRSGTKPASQCSREACWSCFDTVGMPTCNSILFKWLSCFLHKWFGKKHLDFKRWLLINHKLGNLSHDYIDVG